MNGDRWDSLNDPCWSYWPILYDRKMSEIMGIMGVCGCVFDPLSIFLLISITYKE